ncbi:hypothetical protein LTR17_004808 [Elasticomyces elasticus]|nr:hypothetical protein LTR17_004808 [Elasticomyces elasticus]
MNSIRIEFEIKDESVKTKAYGPFRRYSSLPTSLVNLILYAFSTHDTPSRRGFNDMPSMSKSILRRLHRLRQRAFRLNFYRCHLGYFVIAILVASGVLYGSSGNGPNDYHLSYTDALTMAASAMTTTGLNPVNLKVMTGYQQSVLFVLMILGDLSTVSISVVVARRYMFRRQMSKYVNKHKAARTVLRQVDEEIGERHAHGGRSADQTDSVKSTSTGNSLKRSDS